MMHPLAGPPAVRSRRTEGPEMAAKKTPAKRKRRSPRRPDALEQALDRLEAKQARQAELLDLMIKVLGDLEKRRNAERKARKG